MAEGWIKLYRNIQEHWIWQDPKKLKWWLDILLLANHKENKFLLGNELMKLQRGEHHTSEVKLSERWKVDRKTVRRFLKLLESDGMIELKKTPQGTTIKVSNYNNYQDFSEDKRTTEGTTKSQPKGQRSPSKRDTNNNEKNEKNDKNENNSSSTASNYIDFFNNNFHLITPFELQTLKSFESDGLNPQVIQLALKKAVENNARNMQYVKSILHSWLDKNIKTVEEVQAEQKQFKGSINKNNNNGFKKDNFNSYKQREYDYDELERKLLGWDKEE